MIVLRVPEQDCDDLPVRQKFTWLVMQKPIIFPDPFHSFHKLGDIAIPPAKEPTENNGPSLLVRSDVVANWILSYGKGHVRCRHIRNLLAICQTSRDRDSNRMIIVKPIAMTKPNDARVVSVGCLKSFGG